jgi:hypothetical protein
MFRHLRAILRERLCPCEYVKTRQLSMVSGSVTLCAPCAHKVTSTLQYAFGFCSDVSFIGTIFSRNWRLLFVLSLLISDLKFVFLLL